MNRSVLFICAHNQGRSVASEYLFRKMLKERGERLASQVEVSSAGIFLEEDAKWFRSFGLELSKNIFGVPPYRNLTTMLQKRGIDISNSRSRELSTSLVEEADLIIVSEEYPPFRKGAITTSWPSAKDKTFTFKEFVEAKVEGDYLVTEDPNSQPFADGELTDFSSEYWELCVAEIERHLLQKMDKFLNYLHLD